MGRFYLTLGLLAAGCLVVAAAAIVFALEGKAVARHALAAKATGSSIATATGDQPDVATLADADEAAIALAALPSSGKTDETAFLRRYGADAQTVLAERWKTEGRGLHAETAAIYARAFTPQELTALRGFYATPIGHSIARKQTRLLGALSAAAEPYEKSLYAISDAPPSR